MSPLQSVNIDVSAYQGEFTTLRLSAGNIGGSIYDTAILPDDITVQQKLRKIKKPLQKPDFTVASNSFLKY